MDINNKYRQNGIWVISYYDDNDKLKINYVESPNADEREKVKEFFSKKHPCRKRNNRPKGIRKNGRLFRL